MNEAEKTYLGSPYEYVEDHELLDVRAFHHKFGQVDSATPTHLTRRKLAERANFMLEELREFAVAAGLYLSCKEGFGPDMGSYLTSPDVKFELHALYTDQDLPLQADALVDLVYVVKGTAAMMGLPWRALWDDVNGANMRKEPGETHRKMGFGADIRKPEGWVGPKTVEILAAADYDRSTYLDNFGDFMDLICLDDPGART